RRGEYVERTFAHLYDTGGLRRTYLRGHQNILKRLIVHAGAFNLGLLMRHAIGRGTARGLQGGGRPCFVLWLTVYTQLAQLGTTLASCVGVPRSLSRVGASFFAHARAFSATRCWAGRSYAKPTCRPLTPRAGGEIQFAKRPISVTGCIRLWIY